MQRVHQTWQDTDVVVLAISLDGTGEKAVKPFLAEHGYTMPTLVDPRMEVARQFEVRMVPTTVVVNRAGAIVARGMGPFDFESAAFAQYVRALVAEPRG